MHSITACMKKCSAGRDGQTTGWESLQFLKLVPGGLGLHWKRFCAE